MRHALIWFLVVVFACSGIAEGASTLINAFNSGELSPLLRGRTDVRKYYSGCETLENMLVMPYGGVTKRPGSYYIADAKNAGSACVLISFEQSTEQAYVIEAGSRYFRFYTDGGQIEVGVGTEDISALDNVKAHWFLNEDEDTTVFDEEAGAHDGTATVDCAVLYSSLPMYLSEIQASSVGSGCFNLDGQYTVEISDHSDFSFTDDSNDTAFSFLCWANVLSQENLQVLLSKWRKGSTTSEWRFSLNDERKLQLHLADTSASLAGDRVAQWKLNDDAANTAVDDIVAVVPHDGVLTPSDTADITTTGKINDCFDFGGAEAVEVTDHAALSFGNGTVDSVFSVAAWVYVTSHTSSQVILAKWDSNTDREWSFNFTSAEKLKMTLTDESANAFIKKETDDALTTGWHFVVMTYDATEDESGITLYVDNVVVAQTASSSGGTYVAMEDLTSKLAIGASYLASALANYFQDKIDNVILFDVELSQANVSTLWNDGDGMETMGSAEPYATSTSAVSTGWHFFGATYSAPADETTAASSIILYVDGAAVSSTATNDASYTAMQNGAEEIRIGSARNTGDSANEDFLASCIDEVSVYGDVVTPTEIASLYDTTIYEVSTPYLAADLFDIQYVQSADVMYFVHPDYVPRTLSRSAHNAWTLAEVDYTEGPFLDENITTTTITPSATAGDITLTASASLFNREHVGSHWQISYYVEAVEVAGQVTDDANSTSLTVYKGQDYDFNTYNTWVGKTTLQRSYDSGTTWFDVMPFTSGTAENVTYSDEEDLDDAIYRVHYIDTSGTMEYSLIAHSFKRSGIVEITAFTSITVVDGTVTKTLGSTGATKYWNKAAWSDDEGYPSCIAFFEERQAFANTLNSPQTIWFSETDDWDSFIEGAETTDSLNRTIASNQVNAIKWLAPQTALMLGTTGGEWKLFASGTDEPLAPDNLNAKRQSGHGSTDIQALVMNNSIIFVQRQGEIVRQLQYSFDLDVWLALDLTMLAEHITGDGITQIALQRVPYPILWCVREDGELAGLTLEESQEVLGWHHHDYGGDVESVAVIPGSAEDEIWIAIERVIDSNTVRYIEQIQPINWGSEQSSCFFVDSGLSFDGGDAVTISGVTKADPAVITATAHGLADGSQIRIIDIVGMIELNDNVYSVGTVVNANSFQLRDYSDAMNIDSTGFTSYTSGGEATWVENNFATLGHLEGETLSIMGDGGYYGQETVSTSTITLGDYYNRVHAGLPYTAKIKPMKLSMASDPGALFGINQRITEVVLRLDSALDCEVGDTWTNLISYAFREVDDVLEEATPLYTGDKVLLFPGSYELAGNICIQSEKPLPLTVLGLKAQFEAYP